jgi:hypothetical protein
MGESFERENQLKPQTGLPTRFNGLEQARFRIFMASLSVRLPCSVDRLFNAIHMSTSSSSMPEARLRNE